MQRICFFAVLFAVAVLPHVAGAEQGGRAAEEVDLELVLAVDASGSVSTSLLDTQRNAFAAASRKPSLQNAILSGPLQKVAVLYFEFSGQNEQTLIVPWTTLSGAQDMDHFANALQSATGSGLAGETSISGAMMFARNVLAANGYASYRKVVDIAGNGRNSDGPTVQDALQYLRQTGAVVNALVLPEPRLSDIGPYATLFSGNDGPLSEYFKTQVIGGAGAFAITVDPKVGYDDVILRKLILEIAWVDKAETSF